MHTDSKPQTSSETLASHDLRPIRKTSRRKKLKYCHRVSDTTLHKRKTNQLTILIQNLLRIAGKLLRRSKTTFKQLAKLLLNRNVGISACLIS